ncbi:MAG TPA: hypothetical protein VMN36_09185 [Verrucomicrobiales bacterium]|nr:hypothetical protein [Verrucomicrobiales bacterium]
MAGFAHFVVAIVRPVLVLMAKGGSVAFWTYPGGGLFLSFVTGTAGALGARRSALGALFVLFAFASKSGYPAAVMPIVFAGSGRERLRGDCNASAGGKPRYQGANIDKMKNTVGMTAKERVTKYTYNDTGALSGIYGRAIRRKKE